MSKKQLIIYLLILLTWAALYTPHLRTSPGWYGVEFNSLIPGLSILHGHPSDQVLPISFFNGCWCYQPISIILHGVAAQMMGGDILGARILAILLGLVTALTAFSMLANRGKPWLGASAALLILLAPQAIIHYRWIYPHVWVGLGALIALILLEEFEHSPKIDWLIGGACAIGFFGHLLAIYPLTLCLLYRGYNWRSWYRIAILPICVLMSSIAFGYWTSHGLIIKDFKELYYIYTQCSGRTNSLDKIRNLLIFFSLDWFHVLAFASFGVLIYFRRFTVLIFTIGMVFAVLQNRPEVMTFYYQAMIFLPLLGLCMAYSLNDICDTFTEKFKWFLKPLILVGLPFALFLKGDITQSYSEKMITRCDIVVEPSSRNIEDVTKWVNEHTIPTDYVVAYKNAGWLLQCHWSDIFQAVAWKNGGCLPDYWRYRDKSEFLYPADITKAKYLVVTPLDRGFPFHQPIIIKFLKETTAGWRKVYQNTTCTVFENPNLSATSPNSKGATELIRN